MLIMADYQDNLPKAYDAQTYDSMKGLFSLIYEKSIELTHPSKLRQWAFIKLVVLCIMAALSFFGNILTMRKIIIRTTSRTRQRNSSAKVYELIFHLTIADLLVTAFCMLGEALWSYEYMAQWIAADLMCRILKSLQMFGLYLSTYILILIGIDRWIAVMYPLASRNVKKRYQRMIMFVYLLSFLLTLPQFFTFYVIREPFVDEYHLCVTHGFYTESWRDKFFTTFTLVFLFLLPMTVLACTYISSLRTISISEKKMIIPNQERNLLAKSNRNRLQRLSKEKPLRISFGIIFTFMLCWTPYYTAMIIFLFFTPDKQFAENFLEITFVLGMSNCLINPLIYGAFHLCPGKWKSNQLNCSLKTKLRSFFHFSTSLKMWPRKVNREYVVLQHQNQGNGVLIRQY